MDYSQTQVEGEEHPGLWGTCKLFHLAKRSRWETGKRWAEATLQRHNHRTLQVVESCNSPRLICGAYKMHLCQWYENTTAAKHWRLWFIVPNKEDSASLSLQNKQCLTRWGFALTRRRAAQGGKRWRREEWAPLPSLFPHFWAGADCFQPSFSALLVPGGDFEWRTEEEALWGKKGL